MKVGDFSVKHCHFPWLCLITRGQPGSHWENTYENYDTQTHAHTLDDFGDCKSKKPPFSIGNHLQAHVHCAFSKYHGRWPAIRPQVVPFFGGDPIDLLVFSFETGRISELVRIHNWRSYIYGVSWNGSPKPWISILKLYKMVQFLGWFGGPPFRETPIQFHHVPSVTGHDPAMIINSPEVLPQSWKSSESHQHNPRKN